MGWRGFGFVHHSRTIFCRAVPNPNITIRNFSIAVWRRVRVGGASMRLLELPWLRCSAKSPLNSAFLDGRGGVLHPRRGLPPAHHAPPTRCTHCGRAAPTPWVAPCPPRTTHPVHSLRSCCTHAVGCPLPTTHHPPGALTASLTRMARRRCATGSATTRRWTSTTRRSSKSTCVSRGRATASCSARYALSRLREVDWMRAAWGSTTKAEFMK
jgi:hypothetical protein